MTKEEIISSGLLELYATGTASSEDVRLVEECLKKYPELKQELNDIERSLEEYALANAMQPSAALKDKILSQIASQPAKKTPIAQIIPITKKIYRVPFSFKMLAAVLAILLVESIVLIYSFYTKYHHTLDDLKFAQQTIEQQKESNKAMTSDLGIITDKYAQPVVLNGTPKAPEALAKLFWMKNSGDVYVDPSNLPEVAAGKQYQLWAIVDGKPVNGGMIQTKKGTYHIQKMKSFGKAEAFAITLENAGGSPTPTLNEMIVSAKM